MIPFLALLAFFAQSADATLPPAPAHARLTVEGRGVQVYTCGVKDNAFAWSFKEPQADLFDTTTHQPVGTHTIGPTWTWNDGSAITGEVLQTVPSADPRNIPSLLLKVHSVGGSGALSNIAFVRRSDAQAGATPISACDAYHNNDIAKVPYIAIYTFYSAN